MLELARILAALDRAADQPATLATLVQVEGSSYRRPGARLLLLPDGTRLGSISGGCLEDDVTERARRVLATGVPELAVYDTTEENDLVWGVGTGCQGIVWVFLERVPAVRPLWVSRLRANLAARRATAMWVDFAGDAPTGTQLASPTAEDEVHTGFDETIEAPPALLLCGAGDDAQPLARLAREAGWHVIVTDTRPGYVTSERFPTADRLLAAPVNEIVAGLTLDRRTYAVVLTHRYRDDLEFLRWLLPTDIPYIGQLGPRQRTDRLLTELARDGLVMDFKLRRKLHAPVGLDLGGGTPETVALSILAEAQARLAGRGAGFLRDRGGPIHD